MIEIISRLRFGPVKSRGVVYRGLTLHLQITPGDFAAHWRRVTIVSQQAHARSV
jgi:hypothetical protein